MSKEPQSKLPLSKSEKAKIVTGAIAAGIVSGTLNRRIQPSAHHRFIDKAGARVVSHTSTFTERTPTVDAEAFRQLYEHTGYWHGTGRFQYDEHGSTVDVLLGIMENGGLTTKRDVFDPFAGPMNSVSLATPRIYARPYADMHGRGRNELDRYGSSAFWASYFIGAVGVKAFLDIKPWKKSGREFVRSAEQPAPWGLKVNAKTAGVVSPFIFGSDIVGNYPILIGIKNGTVQPAMTSDFIGLYETRTHHDIGLGGFTHLEVPAVKIAETEELIKEYGQVLPVVPIEDAERYAATLPFSYHVMPARPS